MTLLINVDGTVINLQVNIALDKNLPITVHPCDACAVSKYKDNCKGLMDCQARNIHYIEQTKE